MMVSLFYSFLFKGHEGIISLFIAFCKLQADDGFIILYIFKSEEAKLFLTSLSYFCEF